MLNRFKTILAAPGFENDPEKTRVAALLNTMLLALALALFIIMVGGLVGRQLRPLAFGLLLVSSVVMLALRIPMRRGFVRQASIALVVLIILGAAAQIAINGSVRLPAASVFFVLATIMAGLLIGRWAALLSTVANCLIFFALMAAEVNQLLPAPVLTIQIAQPVAFTVAAILTVILLNLATRSIEDSLALARSELAERQRAEGQARQHAEQLATIVEIGHAVSTLRDLDSVLEMIYQHIQRIAPVDAFFIALLAAEKNRLSFPLTYDEGLRYQEPDGDLRPESLLAQVIQSGQPRRIHRTEAELIAAQKDGYGVGNTKRKSGSLLFVPLWQAERVIGVLSVQSYRLNAYSDEIVETIKGVGDQAAIAIQNSRLFTNVQQELAERKLADQALRDSEDRYRTMVETFPDIIMLTNLHGEVVFTNEALEKQTGYTMGDFKTLREQKKDFIHPQDIGLVSSAIKDLLTSDKPCTGLIENRFIDKYGNVHWYSGIISKVQYQGELVLQTVTRDITERKQAEELTTKVNFELQHRLKELYVLNAVAQAGASAKSEAEMLEAVVERLHNSLYTDIVGVGLWDEQAGVLHTHPSAHRGLPASIRRMTAHLGDGVVGTVAATRQPYRIKDTSDPKYQPIDPAIRSELCVPILAGDKLIGVLDIESKQPDAFSDADENLLFTIAGQLASALERLRAEQQLRSLNAELEQRVIERTTQLEAANNELESFSYSVSHDLRAPLRAISGYSAILSRDFNGQLNAEGREFLNKVTKSSMEMNEKIEGLLAFSRLARSGLRKSQVDLSLMAEEVLGMLRVAEPDRKVEWLCASVPSADGDATLMRVVLENLLGNAWKYSAKAENARIEFGAQAQNNSTIYFIRDNGVGFDMKYAGKLFGVFQRLHRGDEFEGTGIGLATVQRIIQRHGGRIWAEAEVGKGATFYFTLP